MLKTATKKNKRLGKILIIIGIVVLTFAVYTDMRVRPLLERTAEYQCRVAAVRIINDVMLNEFTFGDYNYDSIINLTYNSEGSIQSATGDMQMINRLKSRGTLLINDAVASLSAQDIGISLGTASGISFLYGRGPAVPVRIMPKGYANAVLISDFSSAGINQTLHRIIMEVEVDITAIMPGFKQDLTVTTDFIVAQTIIVGEVPQFYAEISGGDLLSGVL